MNNNIYINGIETNNLKNIDIEIKKKAINLIVGPSGSGKSSLAYDTVAQIGQHEFMAMFADDINEPTYKVKSFKNMIAAVPIKQNNFNNNMRSTIGTYFGLNRLIGFIYASCLDLQEDLFVLNKESNLCECCHGIGTISELDENKIIDYGIPLKKNPFKCWNRYKDFYSQMIDLYCEDKGIDSDKTFRELSAKERKTILYGESSEKFSVRYKKTNAFSRRTTKYYGVMTGIPMLPNCSVSPKYYSEKKCPECGGRKYNKELNTYKISGLSIGDFMIMPFSKLIKVVEGLISDSDNKNILFSLSNLKSFLDKAIELNIGHLFFHRSIPTLSGGELQRLRMVQVFNTQLSDLLIVLDEPLAGLSEKEKICVFENVKELSNNHTIIVVDHGDRFVDVSKNIIALGEGGGNKGGYLISSDEFFAEQRKPFDLDVPPSDSLIDVEVENDVYEYKGAKVSVAENRLNLITGYSGVGKSTLLREYFPQVLDKYIYINQKPLLGNKNSNVATALDISVKISELFAKKHKKDKKFFSNLTGNDGACPVCLGAGYIEYGNDRDLLTRLECKECEGTGYNKNLKKYKLNGKSIYDVWKMTIDDGADYFQDLNKGIVDILKNAQGLLLGHLMIGQATGTLSGGENIRIKVLKASKTTAEILGIDEPFKGLSKNEIYGMIMFLEKLRKKNKTIVVIDHTEGVSKFFTNCNLLINDDGILSFEK